MRGTSIRRSLRPDDGIDTIAHIHASSTPNCHGAQEVYRNAFLSDASSQASPSIVSSPMSTIKHVRPHEVPKEANDRDTTRPGSCAICCPGSSLAFSSSLPDEIGELALEAPVPAQLPRRAGNLRNPGAQDPGRKPDLLCPGGLDPDLRSFGHEIPGSDPEPVQSFPEKFLQSFRFEAHIPHSPGSSRKWPDLRPPLPGRAAFHPSLRIQNVSSFSGSGASGSPSPFFFGPTKARLSTTTSILDRFFPSCSHRLCRRRPSTRIGMPFPRCS